MGPGVTLVGGARLPLAFIGAGLLAFAAAVAMLALEPGLLLEAPLNPRVVAWIHLWLPGFLLSVCIGSVYQLMPVVLGVSLRLPLAAAWTHAGLHLAGTLALVLGLGTGRYGWAAAGGSALTLGVFLLVTGLFRTFAASTRRDAPAWSFPLAGGWLLLTVVLGVLMALNRRHAFLPLPAENLLRAHAHLGLVGFFLTLLQGTTFQLIPMFTMGKLARADLVWGGLVCTQVGLLLLAPGLAWDLPALAVAGGGVLGTGLLFSGTALGATLATRRRRVLDPGIRAFLAGAVCAGTAGLAGLFLFAFAPGDRAHQTLLALYAVLAVAGGLSLTVLGMLCKIIPFLVWMRAYGPRVGREPVPAATSLGSAALEKLWFACHLSGLGTAFLALLAGRGHYTLAPAILLGAGALVYLANVIRILRHLKPRTASRTAPALKPSAATP